MARTVARYTYRRRFFLPFIRSLNVKPSTSNIPFSLSFDTTMGSFRTSKKNININNGKKSHLLRFNTQIHTLIAKNEYDFISSFILFLFSFILFLFLFGVGLLSLLFGVWRRFRRPRLSSRYLTYSF